MIPPTPAAPVTFPVANALVMVPLLTRRQTTGSAVHAHAHRAAGARLAGGAKLGQVRDGRARDCAKILSGEPADQAERAAADVPGRRRARDHCLIAGDKPTHSAAAACLHISQRNGGLNRAGIAADEAAGLQVGNIQVAHIAARKRVGNLGLTWYQSSP